MYDRSVVRVRASMTVADSCSALAIATRSTTRLRACRAVTRPQLSPASFSSRCVRRRLDDAAESIDINAHAKVFGPAQTPVWKLTCFLAPILGACLIAGSLTIDEVCRRVIASRADARSSITGTTSSPCVRLARYYR